MLGYRLRTRTNRIPLQLRQACRRLGLGLGLGTALTLARTRRLLLPLRSPPPRLLTECRGAAIQSLGATVLPPIRTTSAGLRGATSMLAPTMLARGIAAATEAAGLHLGTPVDSPTQPAQRMHC